MAPFLTAADPGIFAGLILSGIALRNQEIDEHLSMTPINQKDKSSVSLCVPWSILWQTASVPACKQCPRFVRDTITALAEPICISVWTTNVIDHNIDYCVLEKRDIPKELRWGNNQIFKCIFFDLLRLWDQKWPHSQLKIVQGKSVIFEENVKTWISLIIPLHKSSVRQQ